MRILSSHLTPLDRQITESINILEAGKTPGRSLNLKTEWGGAKIPGILVTQPKGVSKARSVENQTPTEPQEERFRTSSRRNKGIKRTKYNGDDRRQMIEEHSEEQGTSRPDGRENKRSRRVPPPSPKTLKIKSSPSPKGKHLKHLKETEPLPPQPTSQTF